MKLYFTLALVLIVYMSAWFVVSLIQHRNDVADIAWGLGFVLMAWTSLWLTQNSSARTLVVCSLVTVWGIRLAWHIHQRNRNKTEDYRYLAWRKAWGKWFYLRSYLQVYLLQGSLLFLIILPVLTIHQYSTTPLGWLDLCGIVVWFIGFYFEVVGDAQLAEFRRISTNKGKLMQSGLWAYTRHPNYFGEVTLWWGIWLASLAVSNHWFTIIGPLTITLLILKVSGIPLLEKKMSEHPEFASYQRRVSKFFPLPPHQN